MPSINEVMERVTKVRPDAYDDATKAAWLIELEGRLYREVIGRHALRPMGVPEELCGKTLEPPEAAECPECGSDAVVKGPGPGWMGCLDCGWTEKPDIPKAYPEDGDKPLLVGAPWDRLYDLYLMAQVDFYNREMENYNNSVTAFNDALDQWRQSYNRRHLPLKVGHYKNLM